MEEKSSLKVKPDTKKNITWNLNQKLIQEAYIGLLQELKRCPTIQEVSDQTELSCKTIRLHIKDMQFEPSVHPLRVLTMDVLMFIYMSSKKGSSASQKLWLQVMEGWHEKTESNDVVTVKNIDMSQFTEYGLEKLKRGEKIEDVLLDPKSLKPANANTDTNSSRS